MKLFFLGAALLGAALTPLTTHAQEKPATPAVAAATPAQIDPAADEVLKRAAAFYLARQSASADITMKVLQEIPGTPKREQEMKGTFAVARPNRLLLRMNESSGDGVTVVSDGRTVWAHIAELKQFTVDDAPQDLETLLRDNEIVAGFLGQMGPLADLFRNKARESILRDLTVLKVAGEEEVGGVKCVRLRGEQPEMDWDAWFQTGPEPALRKFAYNPLKGVLASAPDEVKEQLKGARMEVAVSYDGWKFDGELAKELFAFEPPKDAKKVAQFGPPEEEGAGAAAAGGPEELKGKAAADFTLPRLEGGEVKLAQHKGKEVVVLDFWATWCGPCVRAMPILGEVAEAFKNRGVVIYAVNQREEANVVKQFMAAKKIALPVLMDAKGEVAQLYKVRGIPQTVIIDKDGNVAGVHVGFSPGLKATLTKEIEALLAK